jgi:hypothetical protein
MASAWMIEHEMGGHLYDQCRDAKHVMGGHLHDYCLDARTCDRRASIWPVPGC